MHVLSTPPARLDESASMAPSNVEVTLKSSLTEIAFAVVGIVGASFCSGAS